jgi:hypothetical protein
MDRFVVGTGRCGSTLLSQMLARHRDVVSLFEVFNGLDVGRRFDPTPVSASEIWSLLSAEQPFVTAVLRRGYPVAEIVYPFGPGARHQPEDPLPWLLVATLPRLSEEPDALFDALGAFVRGRDIAPAADHYHAIFDWLTQQCGGKHWVERSGSSVDYVAGLHACFPDARFVHLHRDGREVALSMREHHAYRLPISILYQVPLDTGESLADLGPLDLAAAPSATDPISRILASTPPAEAFGRYWTDQVTRGTDALSAVPSAQTLEVRFEDLVGDPGNTLQRIAVFFALDEDPEFVAQATRLVRAAPAERFRKLAAEAQHALERACTAGQARLGR